MTDMTSARAPAGSAAIRRGGSTSFDRLLHVLLMTSFLGLAFTGLPLLFSEHRWAAVLSRLVGGFRAPAFLHRILRDRDARCLPAPSRADRAAARRPDEDPAILWGPALHGPPAARRGTARPAHPLVRRPRPASRIRPLHVLGEVRLLGRLLGHGDHRRLGLRPLVPEVLRAVPARRLASTSPCSIHGEEALLAVVFIFTIHFFNGHLRPEKFPMDTVIFTGVVRSRTVAARASRASTSA